MTVFLVRRFFQIIVVLLLSSAVIFTLLLLAPGGLLNKPEQVPDWEYPSRGDIERYTRLLSLDKPWYLWYPVWLAGDTWLDIIGQDQYVGDRRGIIRGDWGTSWKIERSRPVLEMIGDRLPATFWLMLASIMISLLIGIPLGVFAAMRRYAGFDDVLTVFGVIGRSIPAFWFGLLIISLSLAAKAMGWFYFPTQDIVAIRDYTVPGLGPVEARSLLDRVMHLAMPVMVLALLTMAGWSRVMRASMLEALIHDDVRTARAKSVRERSMVYKHAFRNAVIPLITLVVFAIPGVFTGAILIETMFKYKGLGGLFIHALGTYDYPLVQGYLLLSLILLALARLLVDILCTFVEPRIRRD
jgi:peptide/nickel transport system permease protein